MSLSAFRALAVVAAAAVLLAGCDVGPLQKGDLMGVGDGGGAPELHADAVCTVRGGPHMLSGSVRDACTGRGISARVGIAGRRQCSVEGKGAYFFDKLPEGNLALIAYKEGYKHFEVPVLITADGIIQDIVLQPDTPAGCAGAPPVDVACECKIPGCL